MTKLIKVSDELHGKLKTEAEAMDLAIGDVIENYVGREVNLPTKTLSLSPDELCFSCKDKIKDKLFRDITVNLDKDGSKPKQEDGKWGWFLLALMVYFWLQKQETGETLVKDLFTGK